MSLLTDVRYITIWLSELFNNKKKLFNSGPIYSRLAWPQSGLAKTR